MISVGKLKQKIRDMSKDANVPHEVLYQNFFFERFLERLSLSKYKDKMIIKGGFLLTSLLGIENRNTADIDLTLRSLPMDVSVVKGSIREIIDIDVDDECELKVTNISEIRHDDRYDGLRVTMLGVFQGLRFYFKLDLSAGDKITPSPIKRMFKLNVIDKDIELFAYNFETVLAEKLQTIVSRGVATTRAKDYFDVYSILIHQKKMIDHHTLKNAFNETMIHRGTMYSKSEIMDILDMIETSEDMNELWNKYVDEYPFVKNLTFETVYSKVKNVIMSLFDIEEVNSYHGGS